VASLNWLDWLVISIYFYLLIAIGLQSVNRDNSDDFAVAGRRISGGVVFASLAASFLGGGAVMGTACPWPSWPWPWPSPSSALASTSRSRRRSRPATAPARPTR
jgi:hypothetical protein